MGRIKNRIFFVLLFFILFFSTLLLFVSWAGVQEKNNVKYFYFEAWVDGKDTIVIQKDSVKIEHHEWKPLEKMRYLFYNPLPTWSGVRDLKVSLKKIEGRGSIIVTQQPTEENDYTVKVLIDDGPFGGAAWYKFELWASWYGSSSPEKKKEKILEESLFGKMATITGKELEGKIYFISPGTKRLPDFSKLNPVGKIYAESINIPPRKFDKGFPGITERFEWFGIVYEGEFGVKKEGEYTFCLVSDDGSKLYIDGKLLIDNDGIHAPQRKCSRIFLSPGNHKIKVEYFQGSRYELALQLFVTPPGGKEEVFSVLKYEPVEEKALFWKDTWHDAEGNTYNYRIPIKISSRTRIENYQISLTLTPENFNYPHAKPRGEDIRFVAEREGKLFELPYWIEKWNPKGESKVWVKVPLIRDTVRVYLYYGNSEVSSKSSGKDVFEYFDDFSEFADWSVYGNKPTVATMEGRKVIEMRGWSEIVHALKLDRSNYAFESLSKLTSGMEAYMPFLGFGSSNRSGDEDNAYQFGYNVWGARHVDSIRVFKDGSQKIKVDGDPAYSGRSGWVRSRFTVYNGKLTQVIHDETKGTQKITARDTHWIENTPKEVGIIVWDGASYAIDWLFVRNYLEPEPTYSLGSEEKRPVEEPLEPAGIISLIRACQKSISEQLEMIKQMKREIELLKARIDQLEKKNRISKRELPRQVINFQGVWDTDWGEMRLTQSGASVSGNYTHNKGKITGIVKGNVLTGKWSEAPSYSEPHDAGDVELELSEDGNSFSGRWRYGSSGEWDGVWTGRRVDKG